MPKLKPFLLQRALLPAVWGGRALQRVLGLKLPPRVQVGESWELYDRPDGSSRVRGSRSTLAQLMRRQRRELLGARIAAGHGGRFPLLLKFLDAREALSVQVHPDDEQARAERDGGKNEAWIVLHAGPKARIVHGLAPGVTVAEFRKQVHGRGVERLLRRYRPRAGDAVFVPAGTVHSVGPDVVLFEVQQNSNVTYRIWDWGRPRELHVEKALAVVRHRARNGRPVVAPVTLPDGGVELVATKYFRIVRHELAAPRALATGGSFRAVTAIAGRGTLEWGRGRARGRLRLVAGDTALVPACTGGFVLSPRERLTVLLSAPGER